jgi:hypothetical protein
MWHYDEATRRCNAGGRRGSRVWPTALTWSAVC